MMNAAPARETHSLKRAGHFQVCVGNLNGADLTVDEVLQTSASDPRYQQPDKYQYVFEDPTTLRECLQSRSSIVTHIPLCILRPLTTATLTELELNGGIHGPNLGPLVKAWRKAIQMMPAQHNIRSIYFDMVCPNQAIALRKIVSLLQHISTLALLKGKDTLQCDVGGCEDTSAAWLRGSLAGSTADSQAVGAPGN
jgi:hypothetical protein